MFVFVLKILLSIFLAIWFVMMFVGIFKKQSKQTVSNKIAYVKEHRNTFGVNDGDAMDDDFKNDDIVVFTPRQLYDENAGGTY